MKSVYPELLRNTKTSSPCRSGWGLVLSKFIKKMPTGYTKNYFFAIEDGVVSFKHIATTSDTAACNFTIFEDIEETRKNVLTALFGHFNLKHLEWHQLALPLCSPKKLTRKKLVSLGKKYPTIPAEYLKHYPSLSAEIRGIIAKEDEEKDELQRIKKTISKKRKRKPSAKKPKSELKKEKRARPGRPKKVKPAPVTISQGDLKRFFGRT